jgi:GNAT superfamily N-acetyltransferase
MLTIISATPDDITFLWDMLYEAAAIDPLMQSMPKEKVLQVPAIKKYLEHWGRKGDFAFIASDILTKKLLGAAWYRLFTADNAGYGYISDTVPELSMAVVDGQRNKGIGTALLQVLINKAKAERYSALSLSVARNNEAKNFYERLGFVDAYITDPSDSSITLKIALSSSIGLQPNEIVPPWIEYPGYPPYDGFWRQPGEAWFFYVWLPYWQSLSDEEKKRYLDRWEVPPVWLSQCAYINLEYAAYLDSLHNE